MGENARVASALYASVRYAAAIVETAYSAEVGIPSVRTPPAPARSVRREVVRDRDGRIVALEEVES